MKRLLAGPRRTFAAATASFAFLLGHSAQARTTPSQPPAAYSPSGIQVHVDADSGLRVFNQTNDMTMVSVRSGRYGSRLESSYVFAPLCRQEGGCDTRFLMGTHVLALRKPDGELVQGNAVLVDRPVNIYGELVDRSDLRTAGIVTGIASAVVGFGLVLTIPQADRAQVCDGRCVAQLSVGLSVLFIGSLAWLGLSHVSDSAKFSMTPLSLGRLATNREGGGSASLLPNGAALTFRF